MSPGCAKVLITGASGQLGRELQATAPADHVIAAYDSGALDVTRPELVREVLKRERPAVVINLAAYTAVDRAELEPAAAEAVNSAGAAEIAGGALGVGARLLHVSTDFVFDGARGQPYAPGDQPNPVSVYGRTKLDGELEVTRISGGRALILRTAWLYSSHGHNFVQTMLRLMRGTAEIGVVCDQVGTPTWSRSLAEALWIAVAATDLIGVHHWADAGVASRYDFAVAVQEEAMALGLLDHAVPIRPLPTAQFPTPARRPAYCVLDTAATVAALGLSPRHWRTNLRLMLQGLPGA